MTPSDKSFFTPTYEKTIEFLKAIVAPTTKVLKETETVFEGFNAETTYTSFQTESCGSFEVRTERLSGGGIIFEVRYI